MRGNTEDILGRVIQVGDPVAHLVRGSTTISAKPGAVSGTISIDNDFRYPEGLAFILRWPDGTKSRPILGKNLLILSEEGLNV